MGTIIPRIEGGFVAINARQLHHAWTTCQRGGPGIGGFRAWLACREMLSRRGPGGGSDRAPSYEPAELARLLDVATRTATAAVGRLVAVGLLAWEPGAIGFPPAADDADPGDLADTIGGGCGSVLVPRRLLRWLARGARPALVAVALAALLRCVSRRRAGFDSWGRMAASWIARTFAVDLRRVKQARAELVALGWLAPADSPAWTVNRWGSAWTVDLGWSGPVDADCHPSGSESGASLPPPCLDPAPPSERENPEPARSGPDGVRLRREDEEADSSPASNVSSKPAAEPTTTMVEIPVWDRQTRRFRVELRPFVAEVRPVNATETRPVMPPRVDPPAARPPLPPPTLRQIRVEDLRDTGRLLDLFRQAIRAGVVRDSEADRLNFVAAAEHAHAVGEINPPGLLARIIAGRLWRVINQDDEDRARKRLREHARPSHPEIPKPGQNGWVLA